MRPNTVCTACWQMSICITTSKYQCGTARGGGKLDVDGRLTFAAGALRPSTGVSGASNPTHTLGCASSVPPCTLRRGRMCSVLAPSGPGSAPTSTAALVLATLRVTYHVCVLWFLSIAMQPHTCRMTAIAHVCRPGHHVAAPRNRF